MATSTPAQDKLLLTIFATAHYHNVMASKITPARNSFWLIMKEK